MTEPDAALFNELLRIVEGLPSERAKILLEMAKALERPIRCRVETASDIVTPSFADSFSGRLLLFHAMHDAALTKKTFEYFFCTAARAAGRKVSLTENAVHPGEDAIVDGTKFSLKTEGGRSASSSVVVISKLMEARWIRDCSTQDDFCRLAHNRIGAHLEHYERIISLRSFQSRKYIEYDLVEVPRAVLCRIAELSPSDFSSRTKNGSSSAKVRGERGEPIFTLVLDGSVEKVTIRNLDMSACRRHAKWIVGLESQ